MAVNLRLINSRSTIASSYKDVTASQLLSIGPRTFPNLMRVLSDASEDLYEDLSLTEQVIIMDFFEFLNNTEGINVFVPKTNFIEVGHESFMKLEQAKQLIASNPEPYNVVPGLCGIYLGQEWLTKHDKDLEAVYSHGLQIFNSFVAFRERHADLSDPELIDHRNDEDLEEAGASALDSFGVFKLIYTICDGKPWLYDDFVNCAAEDVYMTLRYAKAEHIVQARLREMQRRRNDPK